MANNSKIEWTDATWNVITGCTPCSPGCANCYARMMTRRLQAMGEKKYAAGFDKVVCHEDALMEPLRWKKPRRIFVNSMSDTFHEKVGQGFLHKILNIIKRTPQHTYLILTKRPENALKMDWKCLTYGTDFTAMPNLHLGVTVCNQDEADLKIPLLLQTPAAVRFVSIEPMLGPVDLEEYVADHDRNGEPYGRRCNPDGSMMLSGVILGGESGPGARPMGLDWARGVRDQCEEAGVPFFFKQWGEWVPGCLNGSNPCHPCKECYVFQNCDIIDRNLSLRLKEAHERQWKLWDDNYRCISRRVGKTRAGRMLDGREWNELPGKESK